METPDLTLAGTRGRGEIDLFRSGCGGHQVVLDQHLDPARGVSLRAQRFVVDNPVQIRLAGLEHGEDDSQHLVRQRDDGLLVAFADTQRGKLVLRAVALALDSDGLGMVQQPVQQGRGEHGVVVGGNQGGAALVAVADDLEQAVGAELVNWELAQFVHAKDGRFYVLVQGALDAATGVRGAERVDDFDGAGEQHRVTTLARRASSQSLQRRTVERARCVQLQH